MKKFLIIPPLVILLAGCYNDKYDKLYPATVTSTTTCDTSTITYSKDIAPIISSSCYSPGNGCHDAAGSSVSGYNYASSITALQGNAADGLLLGDINWLPRHNEMPKNANKLSDCDINKITRWVNEGYPNN